MASRLVLDVKNLAHPYYRLIKPKVVNDDPLTVPDLEDGNGSPGAVAAGVDIVGNVYLPVFKRGAVFGQWFEGLGFLSLADILALLTTAIQPKLTELNELGAGITHGLDNDEYVATFEVPEFGTLDVNTGLYTAGYLGQTIEKPSSDDIPLYARGIVTEDIAGVARVTWADLLAKRVQASTYLANGWLGRVHLFRGGWGWYDGVLCDPNASEQENTRAAALTVAHPSFFSYKALVH